MYKEKKLRSMSAKVIIDGNTTKLISYKTPVAMVVNGNLIFSKKWQCSVTTIKHVKAFIEDYVPFWKSILSIDYLRKAVDDGEIGLIAEIN